MRFAGYLTTKNLRIQIWDLTHCDANMQYKRFEDLPVWQEAAGLARTMYEFTALDSFRRHPGLRDQLERAALSVSNNIAEGFERGTMSFWPFFTLPAARPARCARCSGSWKIGRLSATADLKSQISETAAKRFPNNCTAGSNS